jgi:hypothetical protein
MGHISGEQRVENGRTGSRCAGDKERCLDRFVLDAGIGSEPIHELEPTFE